MRRLRNSISYANVMATIAILMTLGGTAYAASSIRSNSITSKHVKNNSLTGADIKNKSLTGADIKNKSIGPNDLSSAAVRSLKGPTARAGATGPRGLTGATGPKGDTGAPGAPAAVVTSFASRDTGWVVRNDIAPPNPDGHDWYDYNCNGINSDQGPCATGNGNQTNSGVGQIELIPDGTMVLALQGMSKDQDETKHTIQSANNLVAPWSNNLTGMASISMLHRGIVHERFECALQYANATNPGSFQSLGEPQVVSSYGDNELVTTTIVGSKNVGAGTYNVRVVCHDLDDSTETARWRFVRGNLTAMAARNG